MVIADFLDYDTARTWDQGDSNMCTAYAFFAVLAEFVQQKYGVELEFNFKKYFKLMEKNRRKRMLRIYWLCFHASSKGFKAKSGELVKIKGYRRVSGYKSFEKICETLQKKGPLLFAVHQYKKHDLNPSNTDIIKKVPENAKKKRWGHAMTLRGFDHQSKLLKFQNSWDTNFNIKWLPLPVYQNIVKYVFSIDDVSIA